MELVVTYEGPSDSALKSLTEKLRDTRRPGATKQQLEAAEKAYQDERRSLAAATQKYFGNEKGMEALFASRRYFLQFDSEGAFRIDDVPPGKYRITGVIMSNNPSVVTFARRFLAQIDAQVVVPEGSGAFDLGVIQAKPMPK
jgi:2-polyprenyl-6-methoxyphenol hydroxylase-like FAD-dependent oxidoreductase